LYLVDLTAPLGLCVAVPHPRFDEFCELLALRLWRAVPGSIFAMATVHRAANEGRADHSHNPDSVFHQLWTKLLGPRGVPQVQIHGFGDQTAPEEVAVSTGVAAVTPTAVRIADAIEGSGRRTTRSWLPDDVDRDLRATTNVQGIAAKTNGWVWVHVEHRKSVRDDEAQWGPTIDAIAASNPTALAFDRSAPSGTGLPHAVGAAAAPGTSRYFAREDHVHPGDAQRVRPALVTVASAATITIDATEGDYFRVALDVDATLTVPANGVDGQRILVEVAASGAATTLDVDPSIIVCGDVPVPVTIPSTKRWFGWMIHLGTPGWILCSTALQA